MALWSVSIETAVTYVEVNKPDTSIPIKALLCSLQQSFLCCASSLSGCKQFTLSELSWSNWNTYPKEDVWLFPDQRNTIVKINIFMEKMFSNRFTVQSTHECLCRRKSLCIHGDLFPGTCVYQWFPIAYKGATMVNSQGTMVFPWWPFFFWLSSPGCCHLASAIIVCDPNWQHLYSWLSWLWYLMQSKMVMLHKARKRLSQKKGALIKIHLGNTGRHDCSPREISLSLNLQATSSKFFTVSWDWWIAHMPWLGLMQQARLMLWGVCKNKWNYPYFILLEGNDTSPKLNAGLHVILTDVICSP